MDLQLTGKNIEITPAIRSYVEKKLGKLDRYLPKIMMYNVELFQEKTKSPAKRHVIQVTLQDGNGTILRGEERAVDLYTAVDGVAEVMSRQIKHYKGKMQRNRVRGGSIRTDAALAEPAEVTPPEPEVVKVKRFAIKPMSVPEAIDQMVLLGHDFFLFVDDESESVSLVYRRKDGNYGLIEPGIK